MNPKDTEINFHSDENGDLEEPKLFNEGKRVRRSLDLGQNVERESILDREDLNLGFWKVGKREIVTTPIRNQPLISN